MCELHPPRRPALPSERKNTDGSCARVGYDALRSGLASATDEHLAAWSDRLTPHMLRHYCASQLYLDGMDLVSSQVGHGSPYTTSVYVNPQVLHQTRTKLQLAC